jgi:hypothetical protein
VVVESERERERERERGRREKKKMKEELKKGRNEDDGELWRDESDDPRERKSKERDLNILWVSERKKKIKIS